MAEKFKNKHLWPKNNIDKIMARNISSEMHSGFVNLRKNLSMNFLGKNLKFKNNKETSVEIIRTKKLLKIVLKNLKDHLCLKIFL